MGKKNKKGQPNRKQFGNTDCDSLSKELRQNGFTVNEMLGDGNCLFRALGHQLEGHCRNHIQYRIKVVDYIKSNRLEFEPFIEDDVKFEDHVKDLLEPGTYGGNDSIVAFSRIYGVTIVIHQFKSPAWVIHAPGNDAPKKILHISYHNGDHYNSVVKLNGTVALTQEENQNNSAAVGAVGGGENNSKSKKNNNNNNNNINNNNEPKSSKSSEPPSSSSSTELPRIENLKITNDDEKTTPTKGKNKKTTGQENTTVKPTSQNKPNQKNLSRRQKLDQKKKERKAEAMQRKRGGSISESASQKSTINNNNNLGSTAIVKTLNI